MVQCKRECDGSTNTVGIGRTNIIQEISAAAPLRISHDVFNGGSAMAAALINVWYLGERVLASDV